MSQARSVQIELVSVCFLGKKILIGIGLIKYHDKSVNIKEFEL